jgi:type IV secretion system protein VirD4
MPRRISSDRTGRALGHLTAVENAVGLAAGYGIQLVTVFQDTAQMKDLYKGRWASFIGNDGVRALFNLDDYDTAEYWSKFMGGRLVETRSTQQDIYGCQSARKRDPLSASKKDPSGSLCR